MAGEALPPGFDPAAYVQELEADEAAKAERAERAKYTTPIQSLAAGVEGLAKGLSFGLSTGKEVQLAKELEGLGVIDSSKQAVEDMKARSETGAATAGEIASFLLPAAAGTKLGAKVLGKTGTAALEASAPNLISELGSITGKATGEALPEATSLLGKALNKAISTGAQGSAEGALYGLNEAVSESALDPNYTGEAALANVGWGASMGLGFGTGLGLAEVAIPAAVRAAKTNIQKAFTKGESALGSLYKGGEKLTGTSGDVAEMMLQNRQQIDAIKATIPGIADDMAQATPEMADWMLKNSERLGQMETAFPGTAQQLSRASPETADHLLNNWQKIITDPAERIRIAKTMADDMGGIVGSVDDAMHRINKKLAPEEAELLISQRYRGALEDSKLSKEAYATTLGKLDDAIARMRSEPELFSATKARELEVIRDGWVRDLEMGRNPVQTFNRLRTLRQSVDDLIPYGKDALAMDRAAQNSANVLKELRRDVKASITDEALFGKAAARRASLDEAQAEHIAALKDFRKAFMRKVEGKGGVRFEMDASKVNTWMNLMADARGQAKSAIWGRFMDASRRVTDEAEAIAARIPSAKADAQGLKSLLENAAKRTEDAELSASVTQLKKQLQGDIIMSSGPVSSAPGARQMAEMVGQALLPGVVTGAMKSIGKLLSTATSVPRGIAALSLLERAGRLTAKGIDAGVSGLLSATPAARRVGAIALHPPSKAATLERIERVNEMAGNLDSTQDKLADQAVGLDDAPNVAQSAQMASVRAIAFLASKAPKTQPQGMMAKPLEPNGEESFRFNLYYDAVDRPLSILDKARAGTLTPLDVEAVSTVYPQLMQKMQESLLSQLMEREGPLPYRQRLMAGMLLGQDVDGTLSPTAIQSSQATYQRPSQKPDAVATSAARDATVRPSQTGLGKLSLGNRLRTPGQAATERLDGG